MEPWAFVRVAILLSFGERAKMFRIFQQKKLQSRSSWRRSYVRFTLFLIFMKNFFDFRFFCYHFFNRDLESPSSELNREYPI